MEACLATRLEVGLKAGLKAWRQALEQQMREKDGQYMNTVDTDSRVELTHRPGGEPKIKVPTKFLYTCHLHEPFKLSLISTSVCGPLVKSFNYSIDSFDDFMNHLF